MDDTPEEIERKRQLNVDRFAQLEVARDNLAEDIVRKLTLFNGQLTLDDLLESPIPLLNRMERIKIKLIQQETQGSTPNGVPIRQVKT